MIKPVSVHYFIQVFYEKKVFYNHVITYGFHCYMGKNGLQFDLLKGVVCSLTVSLLVSMADMSDNRDKPYQQSHVPLDVSFFAIQLKPLIRYDLRDLH